MGLLSLEIADHLPHEGQIVDVAIVLGFDLDRTGEAPSSQTRALAEEGIRLYQKGHVRNVLVSGGWPAPGHTFTEADAKARVVEARILPEHLFKEGRSGNTDQNALFCQPIIEENGWKSAMLVVQSLYTERAVGRFQEHIPDLELYWKSVDAGEWHDSWRWSLRSPRRYAARERLVRLYYRLKCW